MPKLKIGIVGCGAIGTSLAQAIREQFFKTAELVALYDIDRGKAEGLSISIAKSSGLAATNLEGLIKDSELVIEAASARACWDIVRKALNGRCDVMVMSTAGLVNHLSELRVLARRKNRRVYIPSGAVCGIDALKAASIGSIKKVVLVTRKNPVSFKGVEYLKKKGIELKGLKKDKTIFRGPAREAVKYFPQNINVAAVLSLAGIGEDRTAVEIVASPATKNNIHEVRIESEAGNILCRSENTVHPRNPKTSYLAFLSAMAMLKQVLEPVRVGT